MDYKRLYWALNPNLVFSDELGTLFQVTEWTAFDSVFVQYKETKEMRRVSRKPKELKPHLKDITNITSAEIPELISALTGAIVEEIVIRSVSKKYGLLEIDFSISEFDNYCINISPGNFDAQDYSDYNEGDITSLQVDWAAAIDFLRSRGYNLDFEEGEFIDITPQAQAYAD